MSPVLRKVKFVSFATAGYCETAQAIDKAIIKQWSERPTQLNSTESGELQRAEFSSVGSSDHAFSRMLRKILHNCQNG